MDRNDIKHKKPIKICKMNFLFDPKPLTCIQQNAEHTFYCPGTHFVGIFLVLIRYYLVVLLLWANAIYIVYIWKCQLNHSENSNYGNLHDQKLISFVVCQSQKEEIGSNSIFKC